MRLICLYRKLIKGRLTDALKMITFYIALSRLEINWLGLDGEKRVKLR